MCKIHIHRTNKRYKKDNRYLIILRILEHITIPHKMNSCQFSFSNQLFLTGVALDIHTSTPSVSLGSFIRYTYNTRQKK